MHAVASIYSGEINFISRSMALRITTQEHAMRPVADSPILTL